MESVGIVGFGKMGECIIVGCLNYGTVTKEHVTVCEKNEKIRERILEEHDLRSTPDLEAVVNCTVIILAVRPCDIESVLDELCPMLEQAGNDPLIISIAAGVETSSMESVSKGVGRFVRAMPNIPVLVGAGMTVLCRSGRTTSKDIEFSKKWFSWVGLAMEIEESKFDVVAAMSGSGPAYFFYFIDAMIKQGVKEGLNRGVARELAVAAAYGAVEMLKKSDDEPIDLMNDVMVPGGSTHEVIVHLREEDAGDALMDGIRKAVVKNEEMGQEFTNSAMKA